MALPTIAYLAIDAGGTSLKSAVLDSGGEIYQGSGTSIPSFSQGAQEQILQAFRKIIKQGLAFIQQRGMRLGGIGIAFPGPFNIDTATPLMTHKFQGIYGLNLREKFQGIRGVADGVPIQFIHDANAVLSGEMWKGNARGIKNAAVVTLGTGLGFAVSKNGKILCNELGGPFVSIFKFPFKDGILEDYTAKRGFVKRYQEYSGKANVDGVEVSDIGKWADQGDTASIQTFFEVGQILAESLQHILVEFEINCLLFSGQISRSFHHMEPTLRKGLRSVECLKNLSVVKSIDHAALLGALRNILNISG